MKASTHTISTLKHLLDYDARRFTSAEIQLKKSLQEWIKKAGSLQLKIVLQKYIDCIEQHIENMDRFLEHEKIDSLSLINRVMLAFIEETGEKLDNCGDPEVTDACLLACIQSINHFKISTYGTAAAFATVLGMEREASIFFKAEVKEKQIDERLTHLAFLEVKFQGQSADTITIIMIEIKTMDQATI